VAGLVLSAVVGGAWLSVVSGRDRARRQVLEREGVFTEARVVELTRTRGGEARYFVVYDYGVEGRYFRRQQRIQRREWSRLQRGMRFPVRYLPSSPDIAWMRGHEPRGVPMWVVPLVSAGVALGAWAIGYSLRRQWRLLSEGRPALARVTHSKKISRGEHHVHRVYYEFQVMSGATRTGHFDVGKNPPAADTTVTIVYDPDEPERQARYPLSLVRTE
jgi:hypothetical protein